MTVVLHILTMLKSLLHPYAAVVLLHGYMLVLNDTWIGRRAAPLKSITLQYSNAPMTSSTFHPQAVRGCWYPRYV